MHTPELVDLVCFTGGEDVHPTFYNGVDCGISFTNKRRDSYEKAILDFCVRKNVKMTGICRGFQFLNVMASGKMFQDVTNHTVHRHPAYFKTIYETHDVSSTHHQLVKLPKNAIPIVWAAPRRSKHYRGPDGSFDMVGPRIEVEGAIFPTLNAFGVQYHPEMMGENETGRIEFIKTVLKFINGTIGDLYPIGRLSNGNKKTESAAAHG